MFHQSQTFLPNYGKTGDNATGGDKISITSKCLSENDVSIKNNLRKKMPFENSFQMDNNSKIISVDSSTNQRATTGMNSKFSFGIPSTIPENSQQSTNSSIIQEVYASLLEYSELNMGNLDIELIQSKIIGVKKDLEVKKKTGIHVSSGHLLAKFRADKKDKIFNCPLQDLTDDTKVPHIVEILEQLIMRDNRIETLGLFRISGSQNRQRLLRKALNTTKRIDEDKLFREYTVHDVATALKHFIREIPDDLICSYLSEKYLKVIASTTMTKRTKIKAIWYLNMLLPPANNTLLKKIIFVCHSVSLHENENHMSVESLAKVWAPNILKLRETVKTKNSDLIKTNNDHCVELVKLLIDNYSTICNVPPELLSKLKNAQESKNNISTTMAKQYCTVQKENQDYTQRQLEILRQQIQECKLYTPKKRKQLLAKFDECHTPNGPTQKKIECRTISNNINVNNNNISNDNNNDNISKNNNHITVGHRHSSSLSLTSAITDSFIGGPRRIRKSTSHSTSSGISTSTSFSTKTNKTMPLPRDFVKIKVDLDFDDNDNSSNNNNTAFATQ